MGRIGRLLVVLLVAGPAVGFFAWKMFLPGLGSFVEASLPVKLAYVGCALAAALMSLGGIVAALMNKSAAPVAAPARQPAAAPVDDESRGGFGDDAFDDGFAEDGGDESMGDDFGDEFGDEFEDSGFDDFDDDEFA